jgi:hypothetical protein
MNVMANNKIAMWSGPRNISTALMYAFNSRSDTFCIDEPLYSYYLSNTKITHPGRQEIIDNCEWDINKLMDKICGDIPNEKSIYYQKHMAHHILPETPIEWILKLKNCFLIREPKDVIYSLSKKIDDIKIESTGLIEQNKLFNKINELGKNTPIVIDSRDILRNPEYMMKRLCKELEIPFETSMTSWPEGKKDCDGIWAKHWYGEVWKSTKFNKYIKKEISLSEQHINLYYECKILYDELFKFRII